VLAESFGLSAGERGYLLGATRGQGLLAAGVERVAFTALASPAEDDICKTGIEFTETESFFGPNSSDDEL
jgi:hypothetical protein